MKTLAELIKDGFTILEDHARELIPYGAIADYVVIQTPDGKQYLTKKDSDLYIEMEIK
jgi:hypothetical protein